MRFYGIALLAGAAILGACGGEKQPGADSATATNAAAGATASSDSAAAAAGATPGAATTTGAATPGATPAAGAVAAAPATGKTVEVKMLGDAQGYRFEPANVTIKQGDAIKWIMVSGGPHNAAFNTVPDAAARAQIDANMAGAKMGEAMSPLMMTPNEAYTLSFAKVPPGKYEYVCTPHAAMNMKGVVTIEQ